MTGTDLLNSVKKQFQVVYLSQPLLDALLAQALRTYQSKAGPFTSLTFPADVTEIDTPADYADVAVCMDANGRWHETARTKTAGETPTDKIQVTTSTRSLKPFRLYYFQALSSEGEVPVSGESILFNYLTAIIDRPNTRRAREVANATGMQLEFADDETLKQRVDLLEADMEESRSIIPSAAVF